MLPGLLERSLGSGLALRRRGRRGAGAGARRLLWTYSDDGFLPHGLEADDGAEQPVVLVTMAAIRTVPRCASSSMGRRFPPIAAAYERLVLIFDGNDEDAVATARERWKEAKAAGLAATYWQQDESGRWDKRAG